MKRRLVSLAIVALMLAGLAPATGCARKVTVTTGEMVLCTAGEILEDNTEQIEVPEDEAADYSVTTTVITCERHADLGQLYADAQKAIAEGDLVAARERLRTIVDRDPTYGRAAEQLAAIDDGQTPPADTQAPGDTDADGDADGAPTPPDDSAAAPVGPVANLAQFVPDAIAGYAAQGILADGASLSRQYLPTSKDADQMVISVDQQVDAAAATAQAAAIVSFYPQNTASRTVGGKTVTVGVRDDFVAAAFSDGAVLVVVEIHATDTSAKGLVGAALAVVEAIIP